MDATVPMVCYIVVAVCSGSSAGFSITHVADRATNFLIHNRCVNRAAHAKWGRRPCSECIGKCIGIHPAVHPPSLNPSHLILIHSCMLARGVQHLFEEPVPPRRVFKLGQDVFVAPLGGRSVAALLHELIACVQHLALLTAGK